MFGIIADLLTNIIAVLFPVFASYKALASSSPAELIPWLQYFIILTLLHLAESLLPFLAYVPFYSWIRLFLHLYLVAPGKQGATLLYTDYVHPFLYQHEREIDNFISSSHDKAKAAGLLYIKQAIEWARVNLLGGQPTPPPPPASQATSYAQQLFSRFALPGTAASPTHAPQSANYRPQAGEWFSVLGGALQTLSATTGAGKTREAAAEDLAASGTLIPGTLRSDEERSQYINKQRDSLRVLLSAFDREASNLSSPTHLGAAYTSGTEHSRSTSAASARGSSEGNLSKSRSELDFDKIEFEGEAPQGKAPAFSREHSSAGSWVPWGWKGKEVEDEKKEQ